jgi:UDP-N-acetylglucosamine 1-carboxyvinyltransferase
MPLLQVGFPTDMQSQFVAALTLAAGTSVVSETIFESRNHHVAELVRMGANIVITPEGRNFVIVGRDRLQGAVVDANDLRGGAALIIAGLAAQGETVVREAHYVERGYERIEEDLQSVGGDVTLIK